MTLAFGGAPAAKDSSDRPNARQRGPRERAGHGCIVLEWTFTIDSSQIQTLDDDALVHSLKRFVGSANHLTALVLAHLMLAPW
jgi:hypothetical protein